MHTVVNFNLIQFFAFYLIFSFYYFIACIVSLSLSLRLTNETKDSIDCGPNKTLLSFNIYYCHSIGVVNKVKRQSF